MKLITHSDEFHTDDVFATALLMLVFPGSEVVRSRDPDVISSGHIVYDVGKIYDPKIRRFDHHQLGALKRENGITYSAFGLLWKEYGPEFCAQDKELWQLIDARLVAPIDANDNGQSTFGITEYGIDPFTIDNLIATFNPVEGSTEQADSQFDRAVMLAVETLIRLRARYIASLALKRRFTELYRSATDRRVLVSSERFSVNEYIDEYPELLYVISPRPNATDWGILAVSDKPRSFTPKLSFPEAWRGRSATELQRITGIAELQFCHSSGFLAVSSTRESAERVVRLSMKERI